MTDQDETENPAAVPDVDEADVEGHRSMSQRVDGGPDTFGRLRAARAARIDADDEDVEGHFGQLRSPSSRGE